MFTVYMESKLETMERLSQWKSTHLWECVTSMNSFQVSTSGECLCKLTEQPLQKATTTVCACLTALSRIPAGVYMQLKKRSWSPLTEAKGNLHTQRTTPALQEEAEKHYLCSAG